MDCILINALTLNGKFYRIKSSAEYIDEYSGSRTVTGLFTGVVPFRPFTYLSELIKPLELIAMGLNISVLSD